MGFSGRQAVDHELRRGCQRWRAPYLAETHLNDHVIDKILVGIHDNFGISGGRGCDKTQLPEENLLFL